ncbi:glycosyltransferase family 4 protein [Candidatus Poribacteria bacterium]|nr:glycosyltransferase family 4 protein [Candidatus Poribacteria bacterium]
MLNVVNPFFNLPNENPQTFHIFSISQTPSHLDASGIAPAQRARELCWMLKSTGHKVYHYGNELSVDKAHPERGVICDEHISVTTEAQFMNAFPDWRENAGYVDYVEHKNPEGIKYLEDNYFLNTCYEVKTRYKPGDIFCYISATTQIPLWNDLLDLPVRHVESGVGEYGSYLPYRIFLSSQIQSWHYGYYANNQDRYDKLSDEEKQTANFNPNTHVSKHNPPQYDAVIPNNVEVSLFDFKVKKRDKLVYLGRIFPGKGIQTAVEIAERLQMHLIIAGHGNSLEKLLGRKPSKYIEVIGPVCADKRRELLADAYAVLCPSNFWEPFGRIALEAMASGTVPIASNSGGFTDFIRPGYNGYRLGMNKVEQGVWAVENVDKIDPYTLRDFALRFSLEQNALRYDEYFQSLDRVLRHNDDVHTIQNPKRSELDWVDFDRKIEWPDKWMTPVDAEQIQEKEQSEKEKVA